MIEITKKYKTRSGLPVRVIATDIKGPYPVVAAVLDNCDVETVCVYTNTGEFLRGDINHPDDLFEVTPYEDFKVDDLCVVWEVENSKEFRYFSHEKENLAWCFGSGGTSYTRTTTTSWTNCRKATEEEIKTKTIKD